MIKVNIKQVIRITSALIFVGCALYIGDFYMERYKYQKSVEELTALVNKTSDETGLQKNNQEHNDQKDPNKEGEVPSDIKKEPEILPEYKELYEKNPHFIGWINIPDTIINYPVVQAEDNDYYLERDFFGKPDKHGTLFLDVQSDILKPTTNLMIYGHNMKDGSMFSMLKSYRKKAFYDKNNIIEFNTIYAKGKYEIISVFLSKVYLKSDNVFKYYQFFQASTEEEFNYFYENIKKIALYDTGVEAKYGDTFLTLSTCDYSTKDGRLVVVAKKVE